MTAQATPNPYDRRDQPTANEPRWASGRVSSTSRFVPTLTVGDLDSLISMKMEQAREEERVRAAAELEEAVGTARRQAWEQGRIIGAADGKREILHTFTNHFAERADRLYSEASRILTLMADDPKKVTKRNLELALDNTRDILGEVLHAHKRDFDPVKFNGALNTAIADALSGIDGLRAVRGVAV